MKEGLSNEEKKRISYQRQNAVRQAWKEEKNRVLEGYGTRKWTLNEQKELLERGAISGYTGHHMKSVSLYPEYAGNPKNIQFLSAEEHMYGAHEGSYHNLTNGYYNPETKTMNKFGDELEEIPVYELSQYNVNLIDDVRAEYYQDVKVNDMGNSSGDAICSARELYESDEIEITGSSDENVSNMEDGYSSGRR